MTEGVNGVDGVGLPPIIPAHPSRRPSGDQHSREKRPKPPARHDDGDEDGDDPQIHIDEYA